MLLEGVSRVIERRSGLAFPPEKWPELRKGLSDASEMLGLTGARELAERFLSPAAPTDWTSVLLDHLTIGETYFFREPDALEGIENSILPGLVRARRDGSRSLRIWSAGCSTGEEPYTLSMLLLRTIPDIDQWDISLLATDLNTESLEKARKGVYTAWSFRGTPGWVRDGFFRQSGEHGWSVAPAVRKLVRFERLNLCTDTFPASWNSTADLDLILCRNVLMYFAPDRIEAVLRGFLAALVPGGYLVVSANELSMASFAGFERVERGKAFCFRKPSGKAGPSVLPSAPARIGRRRTDLPKPQADAPAPVPSDSPRRPATAPEPGSPLAAARRCADGGRFDEAALHCRAAIERDPMNPAGYYLYGVVLQEKGDSTSAAREFRRAIYIDPEFVAPYVSLGQMLHASGNRSEARRHFSNALAILERHPDGDVVRESGGTTVGALAAMIRSIEPDANSGHGKGGA